MTPELDEDAVVAPDGTLALRGGRVEAAGLTPEQLDGAVATAIAPHPDAPRGDHVR